MKHLLFFLWITFPDTDIFIVSAHYGRYGEIGSEVSAKVILLFALLSHVVVLILLFRSLSDIIITRCFRYVWQQIPSS